MCAIGGPFIAQVGMLTRIPSLVFYDTENAHLQNLIAYPFAHKVIVPRCYQGKTPRNTIRYPGYHELSYLHPNHFKPDRSIAIKNGLNPDVPNFLIRMVAWNANHDLMECGWNINFLESVLKKLQKTGNVCISSEGDVPDRFKKFLYKGNLSEIHHFMGFCDLYVGESATMASECAVLGVPAIYIAKTGRGYISDQENRYGLVKHIQTFSLETVLHTIDHFLEMDIDVLKRKKSDLITENLDVANFVENLIEETL
jgi:predicted glycosyltransferase